MLAIGVRIPVLPRIGHGIGHGIGLHERCSVVALNRVSRDDEAPGRVGSNDRWVDRVCSLPFLVPCELPARVQVSPRLSDGGIDPSEHGPFPFGAPIPACLRRILGVVSVGGALPRDDLS